MQVRIARVSNYDDERYSESFYDEKLYTEAEAQDLCWRLNSKCPNGPGFLKPVAPGYKLYKYEP